MRGTDGDEDAGLADFEAAEAVNDGEPVDGEGFAHVVANFAHFDERHRLVGFVFEIKRTFAARMIANDAFKHGNGAVFSGFQ